MLKENLQDAAQILQNILTQPLSIPGAEQDVSLLSAAENFVYVDALTSDLRKIVLSLLQFPESTKTMLQELDLILIDLNEKKR